MVEQGEPYVYGTEAELIDEFRRVYAWRFGDTVPAGCEGGRLDPRWNGNGLFGKVGRHEECILRVPLGRPSPKDVARKRGSETMYTERALERLHYLVLAKEAGLSAEKTKTALEFGVPADALEVCGNDKAIRCILTRPLVLLLNTYNLDALDADEVYRKVWRPYTPPRADEQPTEPQLDNQTKVRAPVISQSPAYLLAGKNPNKPEARDLVSLSVFYDAPPRTPEDYVSDLRDGKNRDVVEALRQVVSTEIRKGAAPREGLEPSDIELIEKHARPNYEIDIRSCPPEGPLDKETRRHATYSCYVYNYHGVQKLPEEHPMTLLQHACSHLRFVLDERVKWVRQCNRKRPMPNGTANIQYEQCPNFFAVYKPGRESCGTRQCKENFDAPEETATINR